ncbi:Ubiquitin-like-conjugating enzyme [Paramyrothecium foliicola]|nr:Ubiquitin-like-conjugating enzyme [Paramyrothecium foliicola]
MSFQDYPNLTRDEFSEACHHLDARYCRATLGPLRKRWKLRTCTALDMVFSFDSGYATYVQIVRPLDPQANDQDDELSLNFGKFSFTQPEGQEFLMADDAMQDAEDADEVRFPPHDTNTQT